MSETPGAEKVVGGGGDVLRCAEDVCLCCVCSLRDSDEFGAAFSPDDECCEGCHGDMSAEGWPGMRCGSLPPDPEVECP